MKWKKKILNIKLKNFGPKSLDMSMSGNRHDINKIIFSFSPCYGISQYITFHPEVRDLKC